jgi:hypothetical protein
MSNEQTEKIKSNRRWAFRTYEQVDLVFYKLELNQEQICDTNFNDIFNSTVKPFGIDNTPPSTEAAVEYQLPSSCSQQNETLNINISSTGISFTSKEGLVPGEYLMMRVLLLSSMIAITTCCKVVYSKPSNPYEKHQYPYTVGVKFVKLKRTDKDLLEKHIRKKRERLWILNALLSIFLLIFIQVPDLFFELATDLFSFVIDEFIEILHLLYEVIEYGLDHIIEHVFHTEIQTTQIIVFYPQNILMLCLSIPLFRWAVNFCKNQFKQCQLFLYRKKSSILYFWREKAVLYKTGIACLSAGLMSLLVWNLS